MNIIGTSHQPPPYTCRARSSITCLWPRRAPTRTTASSRCAWRATRGRPRDTLPWNSAQPDTSDCLLLVRALRTLHLHDWTCARKPLQDCIYADCETAGASLSSTTKEPSPAALLSGSETSPPCQPVLAEAQNLMPAIVCSVAYHIALHKNLMCWSGTWRSKTCRTPSSSRCTCTGTTLEKTASSGTWIASSGARQNGLQNTSFVALASCSQSCSIYDAISPL